MIIIVEKVYNISASVFTNAAKTLSNYAAQAAGAEKYKEIRKGLKVGTLQGYILTIPLVVLTVVFAEPVCRLFLSKNTESAALDFAIVFARYYTPFMLIYVATNLFHSLFRGIAAMHALLFSSVSGSVIRVIASIFCVWLIGIEGIFVGWVISWLSDLAISLWFYLRKYRTEEQLRLHIQKAKAVK